MFQAILRAANMQRVIVAHADLEQADLSNADMTSAQISFTNMINANFLYANLHSASLTDVNLNSATNLYFANKDGARFTDTICPDGKMAVAYFCSGILVPPSGGPGTPM
jgi:uncharacterized protein YjbI with pentapeptide repeats